jgi:hypothetical protein
MNILTSFAVEFVSLSEVVGAVVDDKTRTVDSSAFFSFCKFL